MANLWIKNYFPSKTVCSICFWYRCRSACMQRKKSKHFKAFLLHELLQKHFNYFMCKVKKRKKQHLMLTTLSFLCMCVYFTEFDKFSVEFLFIDIDFLLNLQNWLYTLPVMRRTSVHRPTPSARVTSAPALLGTGTFWAKEHVKVGNSLYRYYYSLCNCCHTGIHCFIIVFVIVEM